MFVILSLMKVISLLRPTTRHTLLYIYVHHSLWLIPGYTIGGYELTIFKYCEMLGALH